jgi:glycosyltransferase involved in cell wall biosynthesis
VLFSGRVEAIKGVLQLAEACKKMCAKYNDIVFIFLGNGSLDEWLRSYLEGEKRVRFIDWIPHANVIQYYHLADITVTPSLIEAFGLVAVEAMACGTCVIGSNADGLDEVIVDGINGIKIPLIIDAYGDRRLEADQVYDALEEACLEPGWRKQLARNAIERSREFSLNKMIQKTEAIYLDVMA